MHPGSIVRTVLYFHSQKYVALCLYLCCLLERLSLPSAIEVSSPPRLGIACCTPTSRVNVGKDTLLSMLLQEQTS